MLQPYWLLSIPVTHVSFSASGPLHLLFSLSGMSSPFPWWAWESVRSWPACHLLLKAFLDQLFPYKLRHLFSPCLCLSFTVALVTIWTYFIYCLLLSSPTVRTGTLSFLLLHPQHLAHGWHAGAPQ